MSDTADIKLKPKPRLKFIDMARSVAILLMLEGHFVDDTLAQIYRDPNNPIFTGWEYVRGFTAPVFLTVTGLIFVYLLLRNREINYFQNIRIRKGFKRVIELIFWGSVVQWYAFHVLECIAIGILAILLIYGLYKLIRVVPLWIYFMCAGLAAFGLFDYVLEQHEGQTFVEHGVLDFFKWIYNPERDTVAWFPIVPWIGFTMFGAMIGALLHDLKDHVRKWYFAGTFFIVGLTLYCFPKELLMGVDGIACLFSSSFDYKFVTSDWLILKLGMVLMELSALMAIDNVYGERIRDNSLFLKIGQNTLTIYILHMVVLYGSLTTLGLNDLFNKKHGMYQLHPWQVALGAAAFIAIFVLLIKYLDTIKGWLSFILEPIRKFFNKLFFVS